MNKYMLAMAGILSLPSITWADQSFYCPQKNGYINVGMSEAQVIGACGQPLSKQASNTPIMRKIPVQQIIYNNMGQKMAFYGVWQIPIGQTSPRIHNRLVITTVVVPNYKLISRIIKYFPSVSMAAKPMRFRSAVDETFKSVIQWVLSSVPVVPLPWSIIPTSMNLSPASTHHNYGSINQISINPHLAWHLLMANYNPSIN